MTANDIGADLAPTRRRRVAGPVDLTAPATPPLKWADARRPLAAYGASMLLIIATASVALLSAGGVDRGRGPWPRLPASTDGVFSVLGRWDAAWYVRLANTGYPDAAAFGRDVRLGAFYPVIPAAIRSMSAVTGLPPVMVGVLIGLASGAAAVLVVWQLTRELAGRDAADRAAALLAFFPAAFVFAMPYTEGLAIAAAGGAILATRRDRWVLAGLLGAVATATRSNTIVIVAALAVAAFQAGRRQAWKAPLIASLGAALTWLAMWARTGDALTWLHAEHIGWKEHFDLGIGTARHVLTLLDTLQVSLRPAGLIDLTVAGGLVLAVIGLVALWRWRPPAPVLIYGTGAVALAAASSVVGPRPRMVLGAFPLIMAVAVLTRGATYRRILTVSAVLLVAMTWVTFTTAAVAP